MCRMTTSAIIVLTVITSLIQVMFSQTAENVTKLHNLLENSINPQTPPTYNLSKPTDVFVWPFLRSIIELDTATQTLTVLVCFIVTWKNEFFTWDPSHYGGVSFFYPDPKKVWYPALGILNTKDAGMGIINPNHIQITSEYTGQMAWYAADVLSVTCIVDITYYPLDTQTCGITLFLWTETETATLLPEIDTVDISDYLENAGWELIATRQRGSDFLNANNMNASFGTISVELTVKRRATTLMLTVLLPVVMLAAINLVVFIIPCQSGERISFSVTVLLSFGVFLNFMSAVMPSSSQTISVAVVYLYVLLVQSTFFVVISCVTVNLHHLDDVTNPVLPPLSSWIRRVEKWMNRKRSIEPSLPNRVVPVKPDGRRVKNLKDMDEKKSSETEIGGTSLKHTLRHFYCAEDANAKDHLKLTGTKAETKCRSALEVAGSNAEAEGGVDMTWARVVRALDWLFFRVFFIIYFFSFGVILAVIVLHS